MILNTLIFNGSKDQTYVENSRFKCELPIILFSSKKIGLRASGFEHDTPKVRDYPAPKAETNAEKQSTSST